jgi:hypothetical protein
MKNRIEKLSKIAAVILLVIFIAWKTHEPIGNRNMIKEALKIDHMPHIKNTICSIGGITDYVATCYFELTSADFPQITKGYEYYVSSSRSAYGGPLPISSFNVTQIQEKLGKEFTVAEEYSYIRSADGIPKHVIIATDETKTKVLINIYEE